MIFSFIVIGKNEAKTLKACFDSIIQFAVNNHLEYEIIYIDSRSTDNSIRIAAKIGGLRAFVLAGKCNAARARNLGAEKSRGDVLCFIDGDMELNSVFGNYLVRGGRLAHPFLTGHRIDYFYDETGNYIEDNSDEVLKNVTDVLQITTGGLFFIKKKLWQKMGGMDNRLTNYEDNDLAFRIFKETNIKILKIGHILAKHHTVSYTNQGRIKEMAIGNCFKYKGVLYRKHICNFLIMKFLFKKDLSLFFLLSSILLFTAFLQWEFLLLYLFASLARLFFIKQKKKDVPLVKRLFYYQLMDLKMIIGFCTFFPANIKPVEDHKA